MYTSGLREIIRQSSDQQKKDDNRAYLYDNIISANQWRLWPLRQFLGHYAEQDIPRNAAIDIRGGWFKINGEQLTFSEEERAGMPVGERTVELPRGWNSTYRQNDIELDFWSNI